MQRHAGVARTPGTTLVMGVLNATPDSFYGPSRTGDLQEVRGRAETMVRDGAHIIDIGGESTRPGAEPAGLEEELRRVVPVFEALQGIGAALSIDTYRAETARRACALGAKMINDVTALRGDPAMAQVVAETGADIVVMHMLGEPRTMQRNPQYRDVIDDLFAFFEERIAFAVAAGIPEEHLWVDPGFGFGKTPEQNLELLRRLGEFKRLGRPILVGTSNKSTIGKVLGDLPVDDRLEGTAATVAVAIMNGAEAVRVHNVKAMSRVARMTDAIMGRNRQ